MRYEETQRPRINKWKVGGIIAAGLLALTSLRSCSIVPAGNVKVLDTFGSVRQEVLTSGLNFPVNPLARRVAFDIRTQEIKETMKVPTKEGLMATLDVSILYHPEPSKVPELYKTVGREYPGVIVEPNLRNITRDVIAGYSSEDLYSPNRQKIGTEIQDKLGKVLGERNVTLESVLLRDVTLPVEVTSAIERKISAKQAAEQMEYVLQKERQEAERRRVEAGGISDAQKIIAGNLTEAYLKWKYLEDLKEMAQSKSTTFFVAPYDPKLIATMPTMVLPIDLPKYGGTNMAAEKANK
jgi:regulator of protease activity HflC (stomatin/prohibitin superfamily)